MTVARDWMTSPLARALGWALLHFLWQGVGIALLLAACLCFFRAARVRYLCACAALAAMVLAFTVTLAACWPVDVQFGKVAGAPVAVLRLPLAPGEGGHGLDTLREATPPVWFVPVWLAGVSLFYCYSLAAWLAAGRLKKTGAFPAPVEWQQRLRHLAGKMGLRRTVLLLESCMVDVPVVIGYLKPVILLPVGLITGLGAAQVEAILIHELAHIRRYDYLVNLLQTLVEGLLFYHPAVWWTCRVIRGEREHCCDDTVVALQGDARSYAATLAHLELSRGALREPALAATGGHLMRRIHRLLKQQEGPRIAAPLLSAVVLLATATLGLTAWQAQTQTQPQTKPETERHLVEPLPQRSVEPLPQTLTPQPAAARAEQREAVGGTPYQKWLKEDAAYIISDAERAVFQQLTTDTEREQFIEQFWLRRDPTPGTPANEFKEEHYRRIAYSNEHFASGIPGWKTDRGRVYITYGPPDEIEDHAAGGTYDRPGGAITTYPFQQWRYKHIDGAGDNVIIEFVDTTGTGDFRMTHDPSEKNLLLHPPAGAPLNLVATVTSEPAPYANNVGTTYEIQARTVSVTVPIHAQGHSVQVVGRVTTSAGKNVANLVDATDRLTGTYAARFSLVPGSYFIDFIVKDKVTGAAEYGHTSIVVQ